MTRGSPLRLGVNIDHVATIRNARGGDHPDPVRAAEIVASVGGDGITAHLREDRRHMTDDDIGRLIDEIEPVASHSSRSPPRAKLLSRPCSSSTAAIRRALA